ncbi:hypothetical protein N7448_003392 [Penicillium atrosanguineum]|uniref:Major facilitator superfamily (MFS) profile domain-containing protein n=1 Tax=Penicillium atrosanguineum TaxID=1132637 RepID=A0A9W9H943_9EURO|nr:Ribonucleoside-diphosphate reductase small chain [Penicillium atrosanguineum]KAJ5139984.1 hypothetical protein N7448_003392 [Penicillium atrosanguineum]KAJ5309899.1 Ribonucleoside-diphosphate reductase small chain [Penicillium atrosanguineum]KAJ5315418.1 hypothetical protein N7476_005725 [Penicillium atrosanguineum]
MGLRPLIRRGRAVFRRIKLDQVEAATSSSVDADVSRTTVEPEKSHDREAQTPPADSETVVATNGKGVAPVPYDELQTGVRDVEALAETWSKGALIAVFINIWFLYFVYAFVSSVNGSLYSYVASSFQQHSLSSLPTQLSDAFSAACFIPVAKVLDTWGRPQGFALMSCCATIGIILMASCNSFAVYCAGNIFFYMGFGGMEYCVDVITADMSQLKNRGLAYAFTSSPFIITAFAGPKVADEFYYQVSWRWGYGAWAIIFPCFAAPLYFTLKWNLNEAKKQGKIVREESGRTLPQSIWHWFIEFDFIGVLVFTAGLVLFELPFDIASEAPNGWGTGYIIAMIVVGFSMLFFFAIWERYLAPKPMMDFTFLTDRTVIGACLLDATYQLSNYCWSMYFANFLQVVNDLSITTSGYVTNVFDVVSGLLLLGVGWVIRRTGYFRWLLYIAVPLYIFAQGLMIYFRRPDQSVGYQVMCQIFISIGGAVFIIVEQLAILAAVDHQYVATALAMLNVVGTIGDSAGITISTAIWTNTFEPALQRYLPESALSDIDNIYENIEAQLSYPVGSAARIAIQKAYSYAQVRMLAAGLGVMGLGLIWTFVIKDINLKKIKQVHGTIW